MMKTAGALVGLIDIVRRERSRLTRHHNADHPSTCEPANSGQSLDGRRRNAAMAATTTKTKVHVPCSESEFKPIETPNIAEPATNMKSVNIMSVAQTRMGGNALQCLLTQAKHNAERLAPYLAEHLAASIIKTVDLGVAQFERPDLVVRPCGDDADDYETDDTRHKPENMESTRYGKGTNTYLGLDHDAQPTYVENVNIGFNDRGLKTNIGNGGDAWLTLR